MKYFSFLIVVFSHLYAYAQDGYPVPPSGSNRVFYIQHSGNHNTFVYDANIINGGIASDDPLDIYKIAYTEGGKKLPLTPIQRTLAFGMKTKLIAPNLYEMHLVASKEHKLYLMLDKAGKPRVYTTVNGRKMYLDKIFLKMKDMGAGLATDAEYAVFYGKDFKTGQNIAERMIPQ